jgi:hypothetical protein
MITGMLLCVGDHVRLYKSIAMRWSYLNQTPDGDVIIKQGGTERKLPLVLCGPILRHVTREQVTVWIALKKPKTVTLRVFKEDPNSSEEQAAGVRVTVPLGQHLHLAVVEATVPKGQQLEPGTVYQYNCSFNPPASDPVLPSTGPTLLNDGIIASDRQAATKLLTYQRNGSTSDVPSLPSFCLPPRKLENVRIVHGSCRKPHGESLDAIDAIDEMIRSTVAQPTDRPHQLYFTGDQIYADDVADPLLAALVDVSKKIVWPEKLPVQVEESALEPGKRSDLVQEKAGFTGAYNEKPQYTKSHLVRAGEYFGMYLLAWSEVLWPESLPTFEDLDPAAYREWKRDQEAYQKWAWDAIARKDQPPPRVRHAGRDERTRRELTDLKRFRESLTATRRTLANVPTYMLFDDHEVTDDWNLNRKWCNRVYKTLLGRRILTNGLLAYALFQAWGNTPERFHDGSPGKTILNAASKWTTTDGLPESMYEQLEPVLGLPPRQLNPFGRDEIGQYLRKAETAIDWHFRIEEPNYRVVWLDTRTHRAFGPEELDAPALLNQRALAEQLPNGTESRKPITLVVSPAPVVGVPYLEKLQNEPVEKRKLEEVFDKDAEAWRLHNRAFEALLGTLTDAGTAMSGDGIRRSKIAFLSGDVHYSFAGRIQYWSHRPHLAATPVNSEAIFAQFTSSSMKNETSTIISTKTAHSGLFGWIGKGYHIWLNSLPNPTTQFGPDWRYRIDYILGDSEVEVPWYQFFLDLFRSVREPRPVPVQRSSGANRQQQLQTYLSMARNHREFAKKWGSGKELVGRNNVSELHFDSSGGEVNAIEQYTWWQLEDRKGNLLPPFPLTRYRVPMGYDIPAYPRPSNAEEIR